MELNKKPESATCQGQSREVRRFIQLWEQLEVCDGLLYQKYESADGDRCYLQLIVPASHRNEILKTLHEGVAGGHLG